MAGSCTLCPILLSLAHRSLSLSLPHGLHRESGHRRRHRLSLLWFQPPISSTPAPPLTCCPDPSPLLAAATWAGNAAAMLPSPRRHHRRFPTGRCYDHKVLKGVAIHRRKKEQRCKEEEVNDSWNNKLMVPTSAKSITEMEAARCKENMINSMVFFNWRHHCRIQELNV